MSAPTPAPGDESPREGYYPDPSIPGYVRYWNGASWVPGTSRPAPRQGEATPGPPPEDSAPQPSARQTAPVDETGPMFFDEADGLGGSEAGASGSRPEPATAWQADTSRQTGFGGDRDRRVSWGGPETRTPGDSTPSPAAPADRAPDGHAPADRAPQDPRRPGAPDPTRGALPGMRDGNSDVTDGTVAIRLGRPGGSGEADRPPTDGTVTMRAVGRDGSPRTPRPREEGPAPADGTMSIRAVPPGTAPQPQAPNPPQVQHQPQAQQQAQAPAQTPPLNTPLTPGPGGGSASWAQQAHQLAQHEQTARPQQQQQQQPQPQQQRPTPGQQQGARPVQQPPVVPWKPAVEDPFQQLARAQAAARPAGLGKRLTARILDTVLLGAVVGAIGFPLVTRAMEHIDAKIEAARLSGETVTVWLLDSTTAGLFGAVLGAFLVLGFVLEALPTAKWGRTLGKKLCGLEVRDIESHGPPTLGAALRRWLVYGVLGLLVIGVVNVLWCLFDRPWRQCWHDKAARTFVAG